MAKERYINAETLISEIHKMMNSIPVVSSYSSGQLDNMVSQTIQTTLRGTLHSLLVQLVEAINKSATLDGPCFLCKQRDGDCQPPNLYGDHPKI